MYQAVYFNGSGLNVNVKNYLKRHRLVFHTPQHKAYDGIPVGNGRFGSMIYHSKSKIHFTLNHTDAIDFAPDGNFEAWSKKSEEVNTAPVSCGHLTITDYTPVFDPLYLQEYEGILDISNGMAGISAETAFSDIHMQAFVSCVHDIEVITYEASGNDEKIRGLELSRWGSRNLFHDYEQVSVDKTKNLGGTVSGERKNCIYVSQKVRGCETAVLIHIQDTGKKTGQTVHILNNHGVKVLFEQAKRLRLQIFIRVLAKESLELEKEIDSFLDTIKAHSLEELISSQEKAWEEYWQQSFIHLPEDEYLENIYYIYSYIMNCCSKGRYPVTFGSIFCHNHDTRNWGHYYHWNHQQIYWGLWAAGKEALCENYLSYRFQMLPNAIEDGKRLFSVDGAFFSDISNYNGYQALEPDTVRNLTCGPQIALDFYRYYKYTNDEEFLRTRAYPFMTAVMRLYEGLLVKNNQGFYEIKGGSTCYESYWNIRQTATDRVMLIALAKALILCGDFLGEKEEKLKLWKDYTEHIYPIHKTLTMLAGEKIEIVSAGMKWDGQTVGYLESQYPRNPFGLCQLSGVFPADLISHMTEDEEKTLFINTARVMFRDCIYEKKVDTAGHSMAPILAARLGMKEDTLKILHSFIEKYQIFKNGLCHFADVKNGQFFSEEYLVNQVSYDEVTDWEKIHEKSEGNRFRLQADQLLHMYFEAQGEVFMAVNEMLLQSTEGVIRVFPAAPENYSGVFCLRAQGGHEVISEMKHGQIRYISIKAGVSGEILVRNPFGPDLRICFHQQELEWKKNKDSISFEAEKGEIYVLEPRESPLGQYYQNHLEEKTNQSPKFFSGNQIGSERKF